jgi:hypothetical protein
MSSKIIVTNRAALAAKYGSKVKAIDQALAKLIAADKKRGLQTKVIDVGSAAEMKAVGGKKVTSAKNAQQSKAAVDAIFTHQNPDYLMILGAPDVIPHQDLTNPMRDDDEAVMSDLPYASDAPYGRDVADFKAPTRVVGRLPDLVGSSDPAYLAALLAVAAKWTSRPRRSFESYFGISAAVWEKSTRLSLKNLLGDGSHVKLSPSEGPKWAGPFVGRRTHFINCHGDQSDFQFYGEGRDDTPIAHVATHLSNRIREGTVIAAECCYGAELWDVANAPAADVFGICSTYLGHKAYGFFGSTNIAYGPTDKNEDADLICRFFLESVLAGASLGRAALEARQRYVREARRLDPTDLKTLAQFLLLGDPSIHPVKAAAKQAAAGQKGTAKALPAGAKSLGLAGAAARRAGLAVQGLRAAVQTPATTARVAAPRMEARAAALARQAGLHDLKVTTHAVERSPSASLLALAAAKTTLSAAKTTGGSKAEEAPSRVCVVVGRPAEPERSVAKTAAKAGPAQRRAVAMVMEETDGEMKVVKVLHSKG